MRFTAGEPGTYYYFGKTGPDPNDFRSMDDTQLNGAIVIDPPEGDMDDYLASLARARDLQPRLLLPAHGPAVLDGRRKLEEFLQHRRMREEKVLAAWRAGLREPLAMIDLVYEDTPDAARPLAARQISAHLERLLRQERLQEI